jgi:hypothetical protein
MLGHVNASAKSALIGIEANQLLTLLGCEYGWSLGIAHIPKRLLDTLPVKPLQPSVDIHLSLPLFDL